MTELETMAAQFVAVYWWACERYGRVAALLCDAVQRARMAWRMVRTGAVAG